MTLGQAAIRFAVAAYALVLIHHLTPAGYGDFAFAISLVSILLFVADGGFTRMLIRELMGRSVSLEEVPALELARNYECANAKLSTTLGIIPRRSVLEAVSDLLERVGSADRAQLTDPRAYNIRWLELLHEVKPVLDAFSAVL